MPRRITTFVLTLTATVAATLTVAADTLVFKNGQRVEGRLIAVRDGTIEFEERGWRSRTVRVAQDEVRRIDFDDRDSSSGSSQESTNEGRPGAREREVVVAGRESWTDTGVDVRAGQSVSFRASGEVRWGPGRRDGAEGEDDSPHNAARPLPSRPAAALIGRIGDDVFFIGGGQSAIRVRQSGRLSLGINDDFLQDNSGSLRVTIFY